MRRLCLLLALMTLAVLLSCGVAVALTVVDCVEGEEFCVGTNNDDAVNGSAVTDNIHALGGADQLFGNGGDDELVAGKGKDIVNGGEGEDTTIWSKGDGADKNYGEGGNDDISDNSYRRTKKRGYVEDPNLLDGGDGDDDLHGQNQLYGGPGADWLDLIGGEGMHGTLDGGPGLDLIWGGYSKDTVYAQDGERDEIRCDGSTDTVYYDAGIDSVDPTTCENRITDPPPQ